MMSLYADLNKMSDTVKEKWEKIGHRLGLAVKRYALLT